MKIGKRIAELREAKGWTQSELAAKARVTPSAINQIESGLTKRPSIETLFPIADALNVDARELAGIDRGTEDLALVIAHLLREMPEERKTEIARYTQYQAGQVTKLLGNESFARYMKLLTKLIDDRNGTPKPPE
jgi:transcriptional regulator with XRE-family HTH domain